MYTKSIVASLILLGTSFAPEVVLHTVGGDIIAEESLAPDLQGYFKEKVTEAGLSEGTVVFNRFTLKMPRFVEVRGQLVFNPRTDRSVPFVLPSLVLPDGTISDAIDRSLEVDSVFLNDSGAVRSALIENRLTPIQFIAHYLLHGSFNRLVLRNIMEPLKHEIVANMIEILGFARCVKAGRYSFFNYLDFYMDRGMSNESLESMYDLLREYASSKKSWAQDANEFVRVSRCIVSIGRKLNKSDKESSLEEVFNAIERNADDVDMIRKDETKKDECSAIFAKLPPLLEQLKQS